MASRRSKFYHADADKWLDLSFGITDVNERLELDIATDASAAGNLSLLKWLYLEKLLDAKAQNYDGMNVSHFAANEGRLAVLKWLHSLGQFDASQPSSNGMNASHFAIYAGHLPVLLWLESEGMLDLDTPINGWTNSTPVELAVSHGNVSVIQWLVSRGALDVKKKNSYGLNLAHHAASYGHLEILQWLHSSQSSNDTPNGPGLDPKDKIDTGKSIAHLAAQNGRLHVLHWLQDEGMLDLTDKDNDGETVYHSARHHPFVEVVQSWLRTLSPPASQVDAATAPMAQNGALGNGVPKSIRKMSL